MKLMKKILLILFTFHFSLLTSSAQQKIVLDLERTVRLATDSSLSAQKYQSVYDASRYRYLSWQASRKPQFALESTPVMYVTAQAVKQGHRLKPVPYVTAQVMLQAFSVRRLVRCRPKPSATTVTEAVR